MNSRIKYWFLAVCLGVLPLVALAFLPRPTAAAGLWYVTTGGSDANNCQTAGTPCKTINGAIGKAGTGDTIEVAVGTYTANIGSGVIWISQSQILLGGWNSNFTLQTGFSTVDGGAVRRGLTVTDSVTVLIDRFVFQNGKAEDGGGISNLGTLTIMRSRIVNNSASRWGGGIYSRGVLSLTQTTLSSNVSTLHGGGLYSDHGNTRIVSTTISANRAGDPIYTGGGGGAGIMETNGVLFILDSSIVGNRLGGDFEGPGIYIGGSTLTTVNTTISNNAGGDGDGIHSFVGYHFLYNTTIAGNSGDGLAIVSGEARLFNSLLSGNGANGCYNDPGYTGVVTSLGYNLIEPNFRCDPADIDIVGADAKLNALENYGGPVVTNALLPGSPAIDGGNPSGCSGPNGLLTHDARGYGRMGRCDIGAFEVQPLDFSNKMADAPTGLPGQPLRFTLRLNNSSNGSIAGVVLSDTLPAGLNYISDTLITTSGSAIYQAGVISWSGTVSPGASVTIQYYAASLPNAALGTVFINTARIQSGQDQFFARSRVTLALPKLYLPLIARMLTGIHGLVTHNGLPAAGVSLELRHYDGQSFTTALTAVTDVNGQYDFRSAPSLAPGETYYVRYVNSTDPERLSFWGTADITGYTAGSLVAGGNFDVADVTLQSPPGGAQAALPAPFQWTPRPATPTDSYQLALFDPNGDAFAQTTPLGYVDSVTIYGVPSTFHSGTPYGWYININSPDGGFGTSYYYRLVTFTNALAGSQPSVDGGAIWETAKPHGDSGRP